MAAIQIGGKWGYIDKKGETITGPQFVEAYDYSEGLGIVKVGGNYRGRGGKWGYIDKRGNYVLQPQFDNAGEFVGGIAPVKVGRKWAYIDRKGKVVIDSISCNWASRFSEGLARIDGSYFINKKGGKAIELQRFEAEDFSEGMAAIRTGTLNSSRNGYINKKGEIVIKPQFADAWPFWGGLAMVVERNRIIYIDKTGKVVWKPES